MPKHITVDDIFASVNYLLALSHGIGKTDDIDHLGNRRLRSVGELLLNQLRIGFSRMDKIVKEKMTTQDIETVTPQSLINIRPDRFGHPRFLRLVAAVAVYGPDQSAFGADAQTPSFRTRPRAGPFARPRFV